MNQYFTNNTEIKSERRIIKYQYKTSSFSFVSDNGIFSKDKIDYGSRLLVETYLENKKNITNFLDVGCGYGFLSIIIAKILNIEGRGIDVNKRALKLAEENAKLNKVNILFKESNVYENIKGEYDLIITNPPIRAGKKIVLEILNEASRFLNDSGELWFVIRKDQGAKSIIKNINTFKKIEIKAKNKGFFVIVAKNN